MKVSERTKVWPNIIFFAVTALGAVVGVPFYIARHGVDPFLMAMTVFYVFATSMSITVGYHRHFSHSAFKATPLVEFLFLFFGAAAYEQSAFYWASQHRSHHLYVDTDQDPYSIKKGFFYAHIGWLLFWKHPEHFENAGDLQRNRLVMHQHRYYQLWAAAAGIVMPLLIGYFYGDMGGAFLILVCARLFLVHHATFCINSVCHMFGKATYDIYSSAKDHWLVAFITNGEGYHNFHHRFPGDYRNGVRWYQWDPSKWLIVLLAKAGLVWDLKRVSGFRILAARLSAERQRTEDRLNNMALPNLALFRAKLKSHYETAVETLSEWENCAKAYKQTVVRPRLERYLENRREAAFKRMEARRRFRESFHQWKSLLKTCS
jgi:stearoyl-CoA desaturase (delta-9 desaturase)